MQFVGHIVALDTKKDEENVDESTLLEVTDLTRDGFVEVAYNDRNERCYLKFRLSDLMAAVADQFGHKNDG